MSETRIIFSPNHINEVLKSGHGNAQIANVRDAPYAYADSAQFKLNPQNKDESLRKLQ